MEIVLVTKNKHKVQEANIAFSGTKIKIVQLSKEKYEPKDMNLVQVAEHNAKHFFDLLKKPVMVDDTGVFFNAYPNFPGNHPKLMFELIGYKGLLKLLEGENRTAKFVTVVAYADEFGVKSFSGELTCKVDTKVNDEDVDVLPYERIFLLNNSPLSKITRTEKNKISHRAKAFRKLIDWLTNKRFD